MFFTKIPKTHNKTPWKFFLMILLLFTPPSIHQIYNTILNLLSIQKSLINFIYKLHLFSIFNKAIPIFHNISKITILCIHQPTSKVYFLRL